MNIQHQDNPKLKTQIHEYKASYNVRTAGSEQTT